jgi:hypothetical protein
MNAKLVAAGVGQNCRTASEPYAVRSRVRLRIKKDGFRERVTRAVIHMTVGCERRRGICPIEYWFYGPVVSSDTPI